MIRIRPLAAALLLLAGAACAPGRAAAPAGPRPSADALLRVENDSWSDMAVYAVHHGSRHRLGTVVAAGREVFRIPPWAVPVDGQLRFALDPVGSGKEYTTYPVVTGSGAVIDLVIRNHTPLSSLYVSEQ